MWNKVLLEISLEYTLPIQHNLYTCELVPLVLPVLQSDRVIWLVPSTTKFRGSVVINWCKRHEVRQTGQEVIRHTTTISFSDQKPQPASLSLKSNRHVS